MSLKIVELRRYKVTSKRTGRACDEIAVTPLLPADQFDAELFKLCGVPLTNGALLCDSTVPKQVISLHNQCVSITGFSKCSVFDLVIQKLPEVLDSLGQPILRVWLTIPASQENMDGDGI